MQPLGWSKIRLQRFSLERSSNLALPSPLSPISLLPLPFVSLRHPLLSPTMSPWIWMLLEVPEAHSPLMNVNAGLPTTCVAIVVSRVTSLLPAPLPPALALVCKPDLFSRLPRNPYFSSAGFQPLRAAYQYMPAPQGPFPGPWMALPSPHTSSNPPAHQPKNDQPTRQ